MDIFKKVGNHCFGRRSGEEYKASQLVSIKSEINELNFHHETSEIATVFFGNMRVLYSKVRAEGVITYRVLDFFILC